MSPLLTPPFFESSLSLTLSLPLFFNQHPASPIFLISTAVVLPFVLHFFTSMPPSYDCQHVDCTWPCAHHFHERKSLQFTWFPDVEYLSHRLQKIPGVQSKMKVGTKDCQFCRIFFNIGQSDCRCGTNSHNDQFAHCQFRSNGQLDHINMNWTCATSIYELGVPTGKAVWSLYHFSNIFLDPSLARDARVVPYIAPCMGNLHYGPGSDESLQDSQEDKEEEMIQMSKIYSGALVVVVAATASSPLDSLLRVKPHPGQSNTWRTASLIRHKEMDLNVKFRKRTGDSHAFTDAKYDTHIGKSPWCFQKLLASRCLVFRHDEVVWECQSCFRCECMGGAQENFSVGNAWRKPYQQTLLPLAEREPFQLDGTLNHFADAEAAYSFWETAVENYSGRELSEKTDRLPPISAVASVVAEATGDCYLAGLWRNNLLAGLAWVAIYPKAALSGCEFGEAPHQEYLAPTWSWASLPRVASYSSYRTRHSCDADLDASVLDAWTDVKKDGWFGRLLGPMSEVADGAIILSGVHFDVEMTISEHGHIQLDFGYGEVETVCDSNFMASRLLDLKLVEPETNVDRPRYLRHITDRQTYLQPVCSGAVHLLWLQEGLSLILTPSRRKEGAYERLGIFHPKLVKSLAIGDSIDTPKIPKRVPRSTITLV